MKKSHRTLTAEQQARIDGARAAAEGPDKADLIRQAKTAQKPDDGDARVMTELRVAREAAGISLRDLEERTGISRGNLSRLETGESNPTVSTLRRYAEAIGKTVTITIK
jgi:DNA-binding XRE family transcriptional regulator